MDSQIATEDCRLPDGGLHGAGGVWPCVRLQRRAGAGRGTRVREPRRIAIIMSDYGLRATNSYYPLLHAIMPLALNFGISTETVGLILW
jgi:hypothetical protein